MTDYQRLVHRLPRVTFLPLHPSVPPEVAQLVRDRSASLDSHLSAIDTETGFRYPPVIISPACIYDGSGLLPAKMTYLTHEGRSLIAVRISAPALAWASSEELDGILAHEFAHGLWQTVDFARRFGSGNTGIAADTDTSNALPYRERDAAAQLLDWLPLRLRELNELVADGPPRLIRFIESDWLGKGLPRESHDSEFIFRGEIVLDDDIISEAVARGLLT